MKRLLNSKILLIAILAISSCKKPIVTGREWMPLNDDTCLPFTYEEEVIIVDYSSTGTQYLYPCFNPDNSDEMIYVKANVLTQSLVKYNIATKQETILIGNANINAQPVWTRSGWIFYSVMPNIVYKISENGGISIQVTDPNWDSINLGVDKFTDHILISSNGNNMGSTYYQGIYDDNNLLVDSIIRRIGNVYILGNCQTLDNHHNGYKAFADMNTSTSFYGICQVINNEINIVTTFNNAISGPIAVAQNDRYVFYSMHRDGFYRFDKQTSETKLLEDFCDSRNIRSMSISDDGNYLLIQRIKGTKLGGQGVYTIDEQSDIYMYHIGLGMQKKILTEN